MAEPPVDRSKTMYPGPPGTAPAAGQAPQPPGRQRSFQPNPRLIVALMLVVVLGGAGAYVATHPEVVPKERLEQVVQWGQDKIEELKQRVTASSEPAAAGETSKPSGAAAKKTPKKKRPSSEPSAPLANQATLYLTNGERITGELVRDTPEEIVLRWEYGEAAFRRAEIERFIPPADAAGGLTANQATLYLTNGGIVTGELLHETSREVVLRFEYGEVGFHRSEIRRLEKGAHPPAPPSAGVGVGSGRGGQAAGQAAPDPSMTMPWEGEHRRAQWPHQQEVVVKLMRGTIIDAPITAVTPTHVTLTQELPGGGRAEQTVARADIEQLLFRPIRNERSEAIAENLRTVFPAMQRYEEGMFTIVTDSTPPVVKEYRRTSRDLSTDWYLTFFPLLNGRAPMVQQHLVIFENWDSYIEYAATDGLPGWIAVGYFHPEDQVLYCFNMLGERFAELLYDAYLGQFREVRDQVSAQIKGSRYAETIEGQISEFLQKLETAHSMVRQVFQQLSTDVLRHELTHGMFHNWRLQGIILSQMSETSKEEIEKKRRYLQTGSEEEKRKLLDELIAQERKTTLTDLRAANSWYIEGLAGFMEPAPVGGVNPERLAEIQEARRQNQVLPLEFLHTFRMGSFLGMANQSALYAYAQSWALCHFLLHRYPDGFLAYLSRLAREQPKEGEDTLRWLIEAVGKEQRALEQEFLAYLDPFPPEDPFWLKQMQAFIDLQSELTALASRLWGG